ncbi:histone h1-like protein [Leptomonas seymouri]|uniref:Histone h1-like protein n=1 Tax=Leptomonas seymouri TaxID=5684 RepID=A0A0N1ILW1_LEPSE|nr:histone h1-like protein [Leptomonas seymouri]|eukprot:KPI88428.1 histone h1-like protein [Leptomonas seymouri]
MFRSLFHNSSVLRSASLFSAAAAAAAAAGSGEATVASAAHHQANDAAALWYEASSVNQNLSGDSGASVSTSVVQHHHHRYAGEEETSSSLAGAGHLSNNALVVSDARRCSTGEVNSSPHDHNHHSSGYVGFTGGFGPRDLTEVAVVPGHASHAHALPPAKLNTDAATAQADASSLHEHAHTSTSHRPVITKARRIRLAAAASQAAEVLQAVGTPATALLHSQRVEQLQAEEALLNASLQRLKAERDLAKVRHSYDEELQNFQRGVQERERDVLLASCPKKRKREASSAQTAAMSRPDPIVSYTQESGGGLGEAELGVMPAGDLLGMAATADAEAATAAARTASKKTITAASVMLHRHSRAMRKGKSAAPSASSATPAPTARHSKMKVRTHRNTKSRAAAAAAGTTTPGNVLKSARPKSPRCVKLKSHKAPAAKAPLKKVKPALLLSKQRRKAQRKPTAAPQRRKQPAKAAAQTQTKTKPQQRKPLKSSKTVPRKSEKPAARNAKHSKKTVTKSRR